MADWDDEDFEPHEIDNEKKTDKWEGEDEDDGDVKDNWDDNDDGDGGKKGEENDKTEVKAVKVKKKRTLKEVLKEKEEKKVLEQEKNAEVKPDMEEESKPLIAEEEMAEKEMAEKLKKQKLVEESDLLLAMETFGTSKEVEEGTSKEVEEGTSKEVEEGTSIDSMNPKTRQEYTEFSKLLVKKLSQFESNPEYIPFLEDTLRDLCASMEPDDIKKLSSTLNMLQSEKIKAQKGKKGKTKASKKATLSGAAKSGKKDDMDYNYDLGNEFDDFM